MGDVMERLAGVVPAERLLGGDQIGEDYTHDECLTVAPGRPRGCRAPESTDEVAAVLRFADAEGIPVTARGSGTGLSGSATPGAGSIVVSFERMNRVLEIDTDNHVAVVQPGVRLDELDEVTAPHGPGVPGLPG
jgi:glycolate oxidase